MIFQFRYFIESAMNRELSELYISHALRAFAMAMIGVFIPIYLLKLNYSLFDILYLYALISIVLIIFQIFLAHFLKVFPLKHMMAISYPITLIFLLMLNSFDSINWGIELLAIVNGIGSALYWLPFHIDFAQNSLHDFRGREYGLLQTMTIGLTLLAPVIGGIIIITFGFHWLYIIAIVLMIASIIPLFMSKELYEKPEFSLKETLSFPIRQALMHFARGIRDSAREIIWPIFIFITLKSALELGIIMTGAALAATIATLWAGKITDSLKKNLMLSIATVIESLSWFIRILATSLIALIGISAISGAAFTSIRVPYMARFYDTASKEKKVEHVIFREIWLHLARAIFLTILIIAGLNTTNTLTTGIIITALIIPLFLLLVKEK